MTTATYLRTLTGFSGDARLFKLSESIQYDKGETDHVIVSAVVVPFSGPETYIFPANENGEIAHWGELDGSFRGGLDHAQALENAGWVPA